MVDQMNSPALKRVKRKIKKTQNPLFEKWLKEWRDEASENGSEMQYCFNRALKSLQKFPFKLKSGKECIMLENFGSKLCQMLDKKLEEYKNSNPEVVKVASPKLSLNEVCNKQKGNSLKRKSSEDFPQSKKVAEAEAESDLPKKTSLSDQKSYVPAFRSGAYAILLAMLDKSQEENYKGFLTKSDIQDSAQKYCDASFTISKPGSYYTAWSAMKILIQKQLVDKTGNPAKFTLTEVGTDTAIKLKLPVNSTATVKSNENTKTNNVVRGKASSVEMHSFDSHRKCNEIENIISTQETFSSLKSVNPSQAKKSALSKADSPPQSVKFNLPKTLSQPQSTKHVPSKTFSQPQSIENDRESNDDVEETIFMLRNSFKIILLVDNQERDNKFQQSDQMTMKQLKTRRVNFEIRHLSVGDFIWIARNDSGQELVLPYVVERKRMDDLASSIKDGRFHEQKFRLKQSGIENLIYLVEKYGNDHQRLGLPLPTLMQAISNTQIVGGFTVRMTTDHNHSMKYLDIMTTQLNNIFKNKTLMSCKKSDVSPVNLSEDLISLMSFKDFNKGSEKNKKPTVRNMLVKHLLQLNGLSVEKAKAIVQVYPTPNLLMEALNGPEGEKNISKLTFGSFNRSIGPVTAKQIKMLYTSKVLE